MTDLEHSRQYECLTCGEYIDSYKDCFDTHFPTKIRCSSCGQEYELDIGASCDNGIWKDETKLVPIPKAQQNP